MSLKTLAKSLLILSVTTFSIGAWATPPVYQPVPMPQIQIPGVPTMPNIQYPDLNPYQHGPDIQLFNNGHPAGRISPEGQIYDQRGQPSGRIDENGYIYDRSGQPAGRIHPDGRITDRYGHYEGWLK